MNTRTSLVLLAMVWAPACSDGNDDTRIRDAAGAGGFSSSLGTGASGSGAATSAGADGTTRPAVDPVTDNKTFVPDGIEFEIINGRETLEIVASTVRKGGISTAPNSVAWLVAVKNTGQDVACDIEILGYFKDEAGQEIARVSPNIVGFYYNGEGAKSCLGTGEIGMGVDVVRRPGVSEIDIGQIKRVEYVAAGYLYGEGTLRTKDSSVIVENISIHESSSAVKTVSGTMKNHRSAAIEQPQVYFFPLNSMGRPLAVGGLDGERIEAGAAWDFEFSVEPPVGNYVVHTSYREQLP